MNSWKEFLQTRAAAKSPEQDPETIGEEDLTLLVDLNHQGLLAVEGPDAAKFLQGQVTCDVRELSDQFTRLGAQCTLKGRMLVSFRALQIDAEKIFLRMPLDMVTQTMGTLGKYIVFSKAKLIDASDDYRRIGLCGPRADALITKIFGASPPSPDQWLSNNGHVVIKLDTQRYECWLLPDQAEQIWLTLEAATDAVAGKNLWTLLDIRAGLGEVRVETTELFTPQALNYQLVNGINFRKGCYTGQEIVARLHYRGTLKQHMYRLEFALPEGAQLPAPGTPLITAEQRNIGEIVLAAASGAHAAEALAVVSDAHLNGAYLATESAQKLEQLPLPYAIPSEEKI